VKYIRAYSSNLGETSVVDAYASCRGKLGQALEVLETLNLLKSFKINKNLRKLAKSAPIKNRDKLGGIF
jgi:hypothetical protein